MELVIKLYTSELLLAHAKCYDSTVSCQMNLK
jgi:hypothetical protein